MILNPTKYHVKESPTAYHTVYLPPPSYLPCPTIHPNISHPTDSLPHLYLITPTYARQEQEAELTRMGQTLMHVGVVGCHAHT